MPRWIALLGALTTVVVSVLMSQLLGADDEADKPLHPVRAAGFTVSMPGTPERSEQPVPLNITGPAKDLVAPTRAITYTSEGRDKVYMASVVQGPTTAGFDFREGLTGMAAGSGGSLRDSTRSRYRGHPAADARITGVADGTATMFARVVHAGARVFVLQVIVEGDDRQAPPPAFKDVVRSLRILSPAGGKPAGQQPLLMRRIPQTRPDGSDAGDDRALTDCIAAAADASALERCGFDIIRP